MSPATAVGPSVAQAQAQRHACCAVASDSHAEAALVRSLVEHEFTEIMTVSSAADWSVLMQRNDVAVLLLAFQDLRAARSFHRRYAQERQSAAANQAQVVMLCSRENVDAAYALCRNHSVFDYVMFWPVTHDPKRLPLAMHRACDAYQRLARTMLPATPASTATATPTVTAPARDADAAMPMRDLQVLVVEDHDFQLAVVVSVLISAGLRATGAASAQAALAVLDSSTPALILLDVDMPDMSGLELLRLLKATPRHAAIPVIMLTVTRERELVLEALRDGAADFIVKPFDRDTLLHKILRVAGQGDVTSG